MTPTPNQTPPPIPPGMPYVAPDIPPMPPNNRISESDGMGKNMSYGRKAFLMGLICFALMIGVLAVFIMSYSREENNRSAATAVAGNWGERVIIKGPFFKDSLRNAICISKSVNYDISVDANTLRRGIYEVEVYNAKVKISGIIQRDSLMAASDSCMVCLDLPTDQINDLHHLIVNGKKAAWEKSDSQLFALLDRGDLPENIEYSTHFTVRGSNGISVVPLGGKCFITINGQAASPSEEGPSAPIATSHKGRDFSYHWETTSTDVSVLKSNYWYSSGYSDWYSSKYFGASFFVGIDKYRKVSRSMKYSFLIIALTFAGVLIVEIMRKHPIPLFNYFLIGAALIVFYTLLLSFAELTTFGYAYLIASAMTIALISGYIWRMLRSKKLGLSIGTLLSIIYIACYIMLCLSSYALLMGSLLLFVAVAALMYVSLRIGKQ